jgi:hypothetical protein
VCVCACVCVCLCVCVLVRSWVCLSFCMHTCEIWEGPAFSNHQNSAREIIYNFAHQ